MSDIARATTADGPRFTIGATLSLSFGVLGRNLGSMALISIIVTAVQSTIDYLLTGDPTGGEGGANSFLSLVSYAFITAPVTYATFQDLRGTKVGVGDMASRGFSRVGRVIGVSFAMGVVLAVPVLIVIFVGAQIGISIYLLAAAAAIFVLYVFVLWLVVVPVQVMEEIGFTDGFSRAANLSRGRRWLIVGLLLVYAAIIVALSAVMFALVWVGPENPFLIMLLIVPFSAFYSVMGAIVPAVAYYLLRAEKEGVGIDEIARVFD